LYGSVVSEFIDGATGLFASGRSELGFYTQLRVRLNEQHTVDAFVDVYRTEEPSAQVSMPAVGWVRGFKWNYQPDKKNLVYIRFQTSRREVDEEQGQMPVVWNRLNRSVRLHGQFFISDQDLLACRAEWVRVQVGGQREESGFLSYLEWRRDFGGWVGMDLRASWASKGDGKAGFMPTSGMCNIRLVFRRFMANS